MTTEVNFAEKFLDNVKKYKFVLFWLLIAMIVPYLLYGGSKVLWWNVNFPWGKIFDLFFSTVKEGNSGIINDQATGMPKTLTDLIKFVVHFFTIIYEIGLIYIMLKLVWPRGED